MVSSIVSYRSVSYRTVSQYSLIFRILLYPILFDPIVFQCTILISIAIMSLLVATVRWPMDEGEPFRSREGCSSHEFLKEGGSAPRVRRDVSVSVSSFLGFYKWCALNSVSLSFWHWRGREIDWAHPYFGGLLRTMVVFPGGVGYKWYDGFFLFGEGV